MKQILEGLVALAAIPVVITIVLNLGLCMHAC